MSGGRYELPPLPEDDDLQTTSGWMIRHADAFYDANDITSDASVAVLDALRTHRFDWSSSEWWSLLSLVDKWGAWRVQLQLATSLADGEECRTSSADLLAAAAGGGPPTTDCPLLESLRGLGELFGDCYIPPQVGVRSFQLGPANAVEFLSTGADGIHFSFLVDGPLVTEESPIAMIAPGETVEIVADGLQDFLDGSCEWGPDLFRCDPDWRPSSAGQTLEWLS